MSDQDVSGLEGELGGLEGELGGLEGEFVNFSGKVVTFESLLSTSFMQDSVTDMHMDEAVIKQENCVETDGKRLRLDGDAGLDLDISFKQILFNINKTICTRLDNMEAKFDQLADHTKSLEDKVDQIYAWSKSMSMSSSSSLANSASRKGAVIIGLPQPTSDAGDMVSLDNSLSHLGPNVTLITLNTEEDFPNGSWLGDEENPEMRVRVPITPSDLVHVQSNCRTPEKMALMLLDYMFDRDTQAASNLSGQGKHGKKQLDPLMIYGIRCHLINKFAISEGDWQRIKQNIDSKCRTAWRRQQRGMPLTVKAFRGKVPHSYLNIDGHLGDISGGSDENSVSQDDGELHIHQATDADIQAALALQGEGLQVGEIQILHATPEQISQLQHAHHIQILPGDQVIRQIHHHGELLSEGIQLATMTTDSGEVLHIQQNIPLSGASEADISQ